MSTRPEFQTELFAKGLQTRREVLGDAYVERSLAGTDDLAAPLQKLVTEWCWGELWQRPGLSKQERSMINLGLMIGLNRQHELRAHVRGALRNGLSEERIMEIVLHTAIYCGLPAALDGMRTAIEAISEYRKEIATAAE